MVKRVGKGIVHVFNEKEMLKIENGVAKNLVGLTGSKLSEEQQCSIADCIETHCRNLDSL